MELDKIRSQINFYKSNNKKNLFSKYKREYIFNSLFLCAGAVMIGEGLRMIHVWMFESGTVYVPNIFDVIFDWLTLASFGFFIAAYGTIRFYKKLKENEV